MATDGSAPTEEPDGPQGSRVSRRGFLLGTAGAIVGVSAIAGGVVWASERNTTAAAPPMHDLLVSTRATVPDPVDIEFTVQAGGQPPLRLVGHYWYNEPSAKAGKRFPAIVEFNPYRRRDGTIAVDSRMFPWFASEEYLCVRVDLQGSGDSEGVLTDEYTPEELEYCIQIVNQVAAHPLCDGNVGMMGESWSAVNSLMVAAHDQCPAALKAVIVNCGSDDRYNDDVHYMGGAMMQDNGGWASSMWGWLSQPPDPLVVGDRWQDMWKERIDNADFWFDPWGTNQTRDTYWSATSMRGDYSRVKVPVLIMSGWEDGYKNPVDHVLRGMSALGLPVTGLIGPWGHKYPFSGYPGPRINWLPYAVSHWWDKWLKGATPSPATTLPQLTAWLGRSREPEHETDFTDHGRWVAEDAEWPARVRSETLYLAPPHGLTSAPPATPGSLTGSSELVFATSMLETSSFGTAGNNDLPGDQEEADRQSLYFDSAPLPGDLDCFGYPTAELTLSCTQPVASIAVRLSEISPETSQVHLVSYTFFNLTQRSGDQVQPQPVTPGVPFRVQIPMNLMGHTFTEGWRVRLAVSPSFFPTMWQGADAASVTLHTGPVDGGNASALILPTRPARAADGQMAALLPADEQVISVDAAEYAESEELRPASNTREVVRITSDGRNGTAVEKTMDSGRYHYAADGPLQGLLVDQVLHENFRMLDGDPGSYTCWTSSETTLARSGHDWHTHARTSTEITSVPDPSGGYSLTYTATIETSVIDADGTAHPFANRQVSGTVPRTWV